MPSIIYNDDVEMRDSSYNQGSNSNSSIWDRSTPGSEPYIDPIAVNDDTNRISDGWSQNTNPDGGSEGQVWPNIPPSEKDPLRYYVKTIQEKTRIILRDYSDEYLENLDTQGFKFYVVYTDGTTDEVDYTEIFDPNKIDTNVVVNEAYDIAQAINQYFWEDTNGVHITDETKDDWDAAVLNAFSDLSSNKQYHNILINSLGMLLRSALNNLVALSRSGMTVYDGLGNNLQNVLTSFTSEGAAFREGGKTRAIVTTQGLKIYDDTGNVSNGTETYGAEVAFIGIDNTGKPYSRIGKSTDGYIEIGVNASYNSYIDFMNNGQKIGHIGYGSTNSENETIESSYYQFGLGEGYDLSDVEVWSSTKTYTYGDLVSYTYYVSYTPLAGWYTRYYICIVKSSLNNTPGASSYYWKNIEVSLPLRRGNESFSIGQSLAYGAYSFSSGYHNCSSGYASESFGRECLSVEHYSHAEGFRTRSLSSCSHAEGHTTMAIASCSHAEGRTTIAEGWYSHVEGMYTKTSNSTGNHAEGVYTRASGDGAHAEGMGCVTQGAGAHAAGVFTIADYDGMAACGIANKLVSNALFVVGNGHIAESDEQKFMNCQLEDMVPEERKNAFVVLSSGAAYINGSTSSNGTQVTSDARVKELIDELTPEAATEFIIQLKPKHYYKEGVEEYGFYAQEVEEIPEFGKVLVTKDNTGVYDIPDYRLLNYQGMLAPIVSVEQNLLARVEHLEQENAELKRQNQDLIERLNHIERMLGI